MRRAALALALSVLCTSVALAQDKPPVRFVAANPRFHANGRGGERIRAVVIHTIEGSAGSGINTFRHGSRKVSAHYIVDYDGAITQMVRDRDAAWHAGAYNRRSIGIEHAGFAGRNKWTMAQYRASARLTRWLCDTYGIPKDRAHIVGHREVPGATHGDPGRYFDWDLYMRLVRGEGGTTTTAASPTTGGPPDGPLGAGPTTGTVAPGVTPAFSVRAMRPAEGEQLGRDDVGPDASRLTVRWAPPPGQRGVRVLLEQVGGPLRHDSGHLAGSGDRHRLEVRLQDGGVYRWKVRAWDGARSAESAWTTFRVGLGQGNAVVVIAPHEGSTVQSSPALRWRATAPQVSYRVWLDDDADHTRVLADSRELNGSAGVHFVSMRLRPGRTYWWRVMSYDGHGNPSLGPWTSFRTVPGYVHTARDGALNVVAITPTGGAQVSSAERQVLRWGYHGSRDQLAFHVQVDDLQDDGVLLVDDPSRTNHSAYRLATALRPGTYRWRVRVWDGQGTKATDWHTFVVVAPSPGLSGSLTGR